MSCATEIAATATTPATTNAAADAAQSSSLTKSASAVADPAGRQASNHTACTVPSRPIPVDAPSSMAMSLISGRRSGEGGLHRAHNAIDRQRNGEAVAGASDHARKDEQQPIPGGREPHPDVAGGHEAQTDRDRVLNSPPPGRGDRCVGDDHLHNAYGRKKQPRDETGLAPAELQMERINEKDPVEPKRSEEQRPGSGNAVAITE